MQFYNKTTDKNWAHGSHKQEHPTLWAFLVRSKSNSKRRKNLSLKENFTAECKCRNQTSKRNIKTFCLLLEMTSCNYDITVWSFNNLWTNTYNTLLLTAVTDGMLVCLPIRCNSLTRSANGKLAWLCPKKLVKFHTLNFFVWSCTYLTFTSSVHHFCDVAFSGDLAQWGPDTQDCPNIVWPPRLMFWWFSPDRCYSVKKDGRTKTAVSARHADVGCGWIRRSFKSQPRMTSNLCYKRVAKWLLAHNETRAYAQSRGFADICCGFSPEAIVLLWSYWRPDHY